MKRVKLIVAYDGTNYCGWQIQPNGITIEEVLNGALTELLKEEVVVIGASRTDSGVHAEGNVAVFDTENRMPADKICFALNQRLPEDIRVLKSEEVPSDWHPRKQNCTKTYEYRILNRKIDMPTRRLYTHFCYFQLDVEKMHQAAEYLVGEHDFKSFCTVRTQAEDTVRTIYLLDVKKEGDIITIRISGSGFLYNMVRIIVGTLMKVGMGVYPPEHVEEILDARDRQVAGPKVPARGLTLMALEYEKELRSEITGENKEWKYRLIQTEVKEKGKAYFIVERCVYQEFDRLVTRVTHQAVRNGAKEVYLCDKERPDRLKAGKSYGYYVFEQSHWLVRMEKPVERKLADSMVAEEVKISETESGATVSGEAIPEYRLPKQLCWLKAGEADSHAFCRFFNEIFFDVPNSSALTEEELRGRLEDDKEMIALWQEPGEELLFGTPGGLAEEKAAAGFLMLRELEDGSLEIDSIGVSQRCRGKGLATKMIEAAEFLAAKKDIKTLSLLVADNNRRAYHLYQTLGFQVTGHQSLWYRTSL